MKCLNILLTRPPATLPDMAYDANGNVRFQLNADAKYVKAKKAETVNEFSQLTSDGVAAFTLPSTPVNNAILEAYGCIPGLFSSYWRTIPIVAFESMTRLPQNAIKVIGSGKKGWSIQLIYDADFWKNSLTNISLQELYDENDTFIINEANLIANWMAYVWQDGAHPFYHPLVHYGNWFDGLKYQANEYLIPATVPTAVVNVHEGDFRAWPFVLPLLQRAFAQIGYCFKSPILETEELGRRLIAYLNRDYCGAKDQCYFLAFIGETHRVDSFGLGDNNFPYDTSTFQIKYADDFISGDDACNVWNIAGRQLIASTYIQPGLPPEVVENLIDYWEFFAERLTGQQTFTYEVTVELDPGNEVWPSVEFRIWCSIYDRTDPTLPTVPGVSGARVEEFLLDDFVVAAGGSYTSSGTFTPTTIFDPSIHVVRFELAPNVFDGGGFQGDVCRVVKGGFVTNYPSDLLSIENNELDYSKRLNEEISPIDVLKALTELLGPGLFVTNELAKEVWLFHQYPVALWSGAKPEAYYKLMADVIDKADFVCNSDEISFKPTLVNRYAMFGFAETSSEFAKNKGYKVENPLYGHKFDYGRDLGLEEETTFLTNSLFQALTGQQANEIAYDLESIPPWIPYLWDNADYTKTCAMAPAIGIATYGDQAFDGITAKWSFRGSPKTLTPTVYTLAEFIYATPALNEQLDANLSLQNASDTFFTLFLREIALDKAYGIGVGLNALISICEYANADFRKVYRIQHANRTYLAKLTAILNAKGCSTSNANMQFSTSRFNTSLSCEQLNRGCSNLPLIEHVIEANGCLTITTGGLLASPIASDLLTWRQVGGSSWLPIESGDTLCGCALCEQISASIQCLQVGLNIQWKFLEFVQCAVGAVTIDSIDIFVSKTGSTTSYLGVTSHYETITVAEIDTVGQYIEATITYNDGSFIYITKYRITALTVSPPLIQCNDFLATTEIVARDCYDIEVRRITTYEDGCLQTEITETITL
jgi:hypothetical protein